MKYKIININWETDGEDIELPKEATIEAESEDSVSDILSDYYGWLVNSFDIINIIK